VMVDSFERVGTSPEKHVSLRTAAYSFGSFELAGPLFWRNLNACRSFRRGSRQMPPLRGMKPPPSAQLIPCSKQIVSPREMTRLKGIVSAHLDRPQGTLPGRQENELGEERN